MSACSDNQSTILPFPSSPHWAPTTTTLAIPGLVPSKTYSYERDLPGKPCPSFRIARPAQLKSRPGPLACEALIRIKEAAHLGKQEGVFSPAPGGSQALDIPCKI